MHSENHRSNSPFFGAKGQRKPRFIIDLRHLALVFNRWNFCFQPGNEVDEGAPRFPEKRPFWTAVSRILSACVATGRMTIYLTPPVKAASRSCDRCDYYPGANGQATQLPVLSCTAWGFSCPGACAPGGELLPRLFTLTGVAPGGLFSVTLSVAANFGLRPPHVLCGMLPWGVRTFL